MNNIAQIKLLEEKIVEFEFDITALQQDLKEENEKIKKVNKHNPNPQSLGIKIMSVLSMLS